MASFRAMHDRNLGSFVAEPGAGHFAWSDRNSVYFAMFLRKAARARIPETWPVDAARPVELNEIPVASGWLTDLTIKAGGEFAPALYDAYKGEKTKAAWHFDKELAEATVAYHADLGKKDQFIRWTDATTIDAGVRHYFNALKWVGDGQTFEVHPVFAATYPTAKSMGTSKWADAGKPAGKSSSPILGSVVGGAIVSVGPSTFRIRHDGLAPAGAASRFVFLASSAGDKEYRHTEHVGMSPKDFAGIAAGKGQTIVFAPVKNAKASDGPVALKASSDSGLPVEFYIAHGPAAILDGKVRIAEVPLRATFPIPIKVVAYQFGRGLDPMVKTAAPVEQTFMLTK